MPYCCVGQHTNPPGALWCSVCSSLVEGALVDDYRVLSFVGKGSSAEVYLAEQISLNRRKVVMKILPQMWSGPQLEAFQREAALLAALSHPYILPVFAFGVLTRQISQKEEPRSLPYLILPYAEHGSLASIFERGGKFPLALDVVVTMAREIAEALDYAHEHGVLHRDIKPANILFMGSHALLSDFSVATPIDADSSHLNAPWAGSPAFMAPEVWQMHPGRYSDQYALAVTCFYLLTGQLPWVKNEDTRARSWANMHCYLAPRSLQELRPDLPMAVDLVLQRALAKEPHRRYPRVQDFAEDLFAASQEITQQVRIDSHVMTVAKEAHVAASVVMTVAKEAHMAASVDLRYRKRWVWYALLLNLGACLSLAAEVAWKAGSLADGAHLLLALWPAVPVGPLLAFIFRRTISTSLAWGLFWGSFFGLTNGLASALACLALLALPLSHCSPGCVAGNWFQAMLQQAAATGSQAALMVILGLWVAVIGGALIGIFTIDG